MVNEFMTKNPNILRKQEKEAEWIGSLHKSIQNQGWYGKLAIEFKGGMIFIVEKKETLKPPK
jgi:hypothetical protein